MHFLADENLPAPVTAELRMRGHDVLAIAETLAGATDAEVLAKAVDEGRLLLSLDRDYGDLIFHHYHPAPLGVILFRLNGAHPQEDNIRILSVLEEPERWLNKFTTVTDSLTRSRSFPQ